MAQAIDAQYGNPAELINNSDYCRVVNEVHYQRIKQLLEAAAEEGASVLKGGNTIDEQRFIAPTFTG